MVNKSLKPCPFCGNPAEIYEVPKNENPEFDPNGKYYRVRCSSEYCLVGHSVTMTSCDPETAANEWNKRKKKNELTFGENFAYRTESYSGSGERDAKKIIEFEIFELGNTDILYTLMLNTNTIRSKYLREDIAWAKDLIDEIGAIGCDSDAPCDTIEPAQEEKLRRLPDRILAEIENTTGEHIKYALWLADYDAITNSDRAPYYGQYSEDPFSDIQKYKTSKIILSDLGRDGILYGYAKMPEPEKTEN